MLVTVRQPATLAAGLTGAPSQRYLQRRYGPSPSVDRVLTQLAHEHDLRRVEGWPIQSLDVYCEVLTVPDGRDVAEVIAALNRDPRVDLAQRMNLFDTQAARDTTIRISTCNPLRRRWKSRAHTSSQRAAAYRSRSSTPPSTATTPTYAAACGSLAISSPSIRSRATARSTARRSPASSRSAVNNREGIIGVAPDVSIAALRACWAVGDDGLAAQCSSFSLAQALEVALDLQPNVINLSLAGPDDPLLSRLLDRVIERGIVVVTAHPATAESSHAFPSSHPHVLTAHSSLVAVNSDSPYTLGGSGQRGADDDARRRLRLLERQLAGRSAHDGRRRTADGTPTRSRCGAHRRDSDGHDDVLGGHRFDQRVPRRRAARRHGAVPCARSEHELLASGSRHRLPPQRVRHAEDVILRVGIA